MLHQPSFQSCLCALILATISQRSEDCHAQSSVSSTTIRPFVLSFTPIIGRNGTVGGVSINPHGVVTRAAVDVEGILARHRVDTSDGDALVWRMVSLSSLERTLNELVEAKKPVPDEVSCLAGLQRIECVFAMPDKNDIVLAGRAESWRLDERGVAVGVTTGRPTVRLDDLMDAFKSAEVAATGRGISCSIDPTEEGLARLQRVLTNRNLQFNRQTAELMQKAVGPNEITVTGVASDSHFARVMVAADYLMKRFAMGLEDAPVEKMPSYMDLLAKQGLRSAGTASPRWWLAVNYSPLLRSEDGLSWKLRGPGVKVMTENAFVDSTGSIVESATKDRNAEAWAKTMTDKYEDLSRAEPVFGELRNCMDLSVVAAIITHYDLIKHVGAKLPLLTQAKQVRGPRYNVPQQVEAHLSVARTRSGWIVGVSGGVDLDSWSVLNNPVVGVIPSPKQRTSVETWWWE